MNGLMKMKQQVGTIFDHDSSGGFFHFPQASCYDNVTLFFWALSSLRCGGNFLRIVVENRLEMRTENS